MKLFISYSSQDRAQVRQLVADLEEIGYEVWFDQELSGGQVWWDRILESIRACDLFIFALSPAWLDSYASLLEFDYATDLNKNRLPVLISSELDLTLLPGRIQTLQIVRYDAVERQAALKLARALNLMEPSPPLPDSLPEAPPAPLSPLAVAGEQLSKPTLPFHEQSDLLYTLEQLTVEPESRRQAFDLLIRLRDHPDARVGIRQKAAAIIESYRPRQIHIPWRVVLRVLGILLALVVLILLGVGTVLLYNTISSQLAALDTVAQELTSEEVMPVAESDGTDEATQPSVSQPTATTAPATTAALAAPLSAEEKAHQLAEAGISSNAEWTPQIEIFNSVEMALVPNGCFQMGSNDGDRDETPIHEVCFEEPFWIDVYEVTNKQYGSIGCEEFSSEPEQPRNCVNWYEALSHCESRGARLATEAEWEYAARGPDELVYPWGNSFDCSKGNFDDETQYSALVIEGGKNCDGYVETAPVGSFAGGVSWVGALDLSGSLWEWVSDWYGESYQASSPQVNPQGPDSGEYRVFRGGSWHDADAHVLRGAIRLNMSPDFYDINFGFRCARSYNS